MKLESNEVMLWDVTGNFPKEVLMSAFACCVFLVLS
jgi:hypothetical protein